MFERKEQVVPGKKKARFVSHYFISNGSEIVYTSRALLSPLSTFIFFMDFWMLKDTLSRL
jgi:hypothetical protein